MHLPYRLPLRAALMAAALLFATPPTLAAEPVDEVNLFLGTAGEGNVFPGATLPFGFVQPSPDTGPGSGAGGYKRGRAINGFSQQHISGMGGPLFGHISLMPVTGLPAAPWAVKSGALSDEAASPGYYTVRMAPWNVQVELTATRHVARHRHVFPAHDEATVLLDLGHVLYGDKPGWGSATATGGELRISADGRELSGHMTTLGARSSTRRLKVFFALQLDTPAARFGAWDDTGLRAAGTREAAGVQLGAWLQFRTTAGQAVQSRIAVSYRSVDQARAYLAAEAPDWDFDATRRQARAQWAQALSAITVEGGTPAQRTQFYTALYRTHVTPNDWTGEAPAGYGDAPYYENILCLWDTFRTVNPLLTLIRPDVQAGIVNTLLAHHRVKGWTGDAHSAFIHEHVQNGSNADVVIADAFVKRLPGVDFAEAYQAIRKNAFVDANPNINGRPNEGRYRLDDYRRHGYVPTDTSSYGAVQAVSRTLEYVHNDAAVLTLAREFGSAEEVADLSQRTGWWRNVWDADSGFMRGRRADGRWHTPFDPLKVETGKHYYEGHAWTWSWYVPHDVPGLIDVMGGRKPFVDKLSIAVDKYYEAYNEPAMLMSYLFTHAGRPDKTQQAVRQALSHFNAGDKGLPGNDDSGTTSAWLVWAMLGLYPHAGQDWYYIGSPSFPRASIDLGGGRRFVIDAAQAAPQRPFVAGAQLQGQPWPRAWLRHADLAQGGRLQLTMQAKPSDWGATNPPPPAR